MLAAFVRPHSPDFTPRPLRPPPWTAPVARPRPSFGTELLQQNVTGTPSTYSASSMVLTQPFHDPLETFCSAFGVAGTSIQVATNGTIPPTATLQVLHDAPVYLATHALIILPSPNADHSSTTEASPPVSPTPILILPINAELFGAKFSAQIVQFLPQSTTPTLPPLPYRDPATRRRVLTLPAIPLYAPHPPSIPLLLLFGLGLHTVIPRDQSPPSPGRPPSLPRPPPTSGSISTYLLPNAALGEFPAAQEMARVLLRESDDADLAARGGFNHGLWRNVLALGPHDARIANAVRVAWNVTADARRTRAGQRARPRRGGEEAPGIVGSP
ncbi:hypothetical protein OBBRIDRAFT_837321 [Obba rivulosa]|uniref:Uncharacterized protein n=1 Tax=Obba rivulosa TaxID=1052685 RepID=A0A8E2AVK9_9APHY|nr:hypothetical protein OBBRIDRAFT_837321 [Obba rivulosa]